MPNYWTTRDGTRLRIRDLSDQHLTNAIEMLERRARRHDQELNLAHQALAFTHGEMAQDAIESIIHSLQENDVGMAWLKQYHLYRALKQEKARRSEPKHKFKHLSRSIDAELRDMLQRHLRS